MLPPHRAAVVGFTALFALLATAPTDFAAAPVQTAATISASGGGAQERASAEDVPTIPVDLVALDRAGNFAHQLTRNDFTVTVDGAPRRVLWVRHVTRGPGAAGEAARLEATHAGDVTFAAEPVRNVVVVIDETSIVRGSERAILDTAGMLTDRLGLEDRLAVVRVPTGEARLALSTDRPELRAELRKIAGQAERPRLALEEPRLPEPAVPDAAPRSDTARPPEEPVRPVEPENPVADTGPGFAAGEEGPALAHDFLGTFVSMLEALRPTEGRKVIAIFSGGLTARATSRVDRVAAAATSANATIYAFGVQSIDSDVGGDRNLEALDRLARATGGSFTRLAKKSEKSVAGVLAEISGAYVLGVERAASDAEGKRRALRVDVRGPQLTLRAPAWFVPRPDVGDVTPLAPFTRPTASTSAVEHAGAPTRAASSPEGGTTDTARASSSSAGEAAVSRAAAQDAELRGLLARASEYVSGYEREYSMLVAEERYYQSANRQVRSLRSDLLLVRPSDEEGWVSFRDVFEVDGKPVRDRDDRLKRLFLDKSAAAQAQLGGIRAESSRFNIGPLIRNINVPLFPLEFLHADNLSRFHFRLAGEKEVRGVPALRVAFEEVVRPTLVYYNDRPNLPARGWFLVDPASGAVVGSRLEFSLDSPTGRLVFEVGYQRDEVLGMWVPAEMSETHWTYRPTTRDMAITIDARATYSRFRRFRVTTNEEIAVPK